MHNGKVKYIKAEVASINTYIHIRHCLRVKEEEAGAYCSSSLSQSIQYIPVISLRCPPPFVSSLVARLRHAMRVWMHGDSQIASPPFYLCTVVAHCEAVLYQQPTRSPDMECVKARPHLNHIVVVSVYLHKLPSLIPPCVPNLALRVAPLIAIRRPRAAIELALNHSRFP